MTSFTLCDDNLTLLDGILVSRMFIIIVCKSLVKENDLDFKKILGSCSQDCSRVVFLLEWSVQIQTAHNRCHKLC